MRAVATSKGQAYGILIGTNALGIYYNKKIFAQAGIKTPPDDLGRADQP